jgi:hypothetical protein
MLCQACENIFRGHFRSLDNCSEYAAGLNLAASCFGGTGGFGGAGGFSNPNYRAHQPDFSAVYQSALEECWICMQIFEDVCKEYMEEHAFPQNSTLAEITKRILEDTKEEKTAFISGNFTVYVLEEDKRMHGRGMTLGIRVESICLPRLGSYEYHLADQRGMLTTAD